MALNPEAVLPTECQLTCHVCGLRVSRKQRLQTHMKSKHPDAELPGHLQSSRGPYKIYDVDENTPVPKRTKMRHQTSSTLSHADNQKETGYQHSNVFLDNEEDRDLMGNITNDVETETEKVGPNHEKCMAILAYITKMHLTGTASEQLVRLLRLFGSTDLSVTQMKESMSDSTTKLFDYCVNCSCLFPEEDGIFQCSTPGCSGLRFSGPDNMQHLKRHKSFFAAASVGSQVMEVLLRYKDVGYKHITLTMNTDGVPLYNSSSVSLWPVFLVINELPPSERFLIQNVIVWGLWQGSGKPVFKSFLQPLVTELNNLHRHGITLGSEIVTVRLACVTMDLQAKAQVMEMVPHNGQFPCVTCEIPGQVVKKGKGHVKCFPGADPSPSRSSASVLGNAEEAIQSGLKHVKGVKSVSILFAVDHFNPVAGVVPDYMHGVLLGTTKKLLTLWFSPSYSREPFYIGNLVGDVDAKLLGMKPTDNISRLPRSIREHLSHWKASEYQHWLLFYSIPCLQDILPEAYLENLCFLAEGIYILLGDNLTADDIDKAELALTQFQISFQELYGVSNCGLNVHNIGCHLADYARQHGPLWAWSCFAFEDMNGVLLKSAHGTGDVCRQLLKTMLSQKKLHSEVHDIQDKDLKDFTMDMLTTGKRTKSSTDCGNCKMIGKLADCEDLNLRNQVMDYLRSGDCAVKKVTRIKFNGQLITSKLYRRLQKRNCHTVLLDDGTISSVQFYLFDEISNKCFALVEEIVVLGFLNDKVSHLIRVGESDKVYIVPVDKIVEKVIYLDASDQMKCIARLPNFYNHCG